MKSDKRHIVFCSTSIAKYDRRMQRIIGALVDSSYEVSWISRAHIDEIDSDNVSHICIKTFFKKGILFYLEFNIRLFIKLLKHGKDIVSTVDLDTILAGSIYTILSGKKLVFDAHEYFSEVPELQGKPIKKKLWKCIARLCVPRSKANYTVGECLADVLSKDYGVEFSVIRNVDSYESVINETKPNGRNDIMYLGVLNQGRGIEELILSLHHLPSKYKLKLIGEGDLSQGLRELVKTEELTDRVHFLGMKNPSELPSLLSNGRLACNLLSNNSLSYYYSLANKYFDYIHSGLPMIGMDFPEYRALNQQFKTSILINDLDPKQISQAILQLEDEHTYQLLKDNCKQAAIHLDWANEKNKLIAIYNQL